jgi:hypothetical protein
MDLRLVEQRVLRRLHFGVKHHFRVFDWVAVLQESTVVRRFLQQSSRNSNAASLRPPFSVEGECCMSRLTHDSQSD